MSSVSTLLSKNQAPFTLECFWFTHVFEKERQVKHGNQFYDFDKRIYFTVESSQKFNLRWGLFFDYSVSHFLPFHID
jgi:hypothetical protein